jgi:hydrogenase nickel incorporation protein HypA/HybF
MHEFSLMMGVIDAVSETAKANGATCVTVVNLTVGDMTEVVEEAMDFAFDVLKEDTVAKDAKLNIKFVHPRSYCAACDIEFEHDRYHWACPKCDSLATKLIAGRELYIESIEVED